MSKLRDAWETGRTAFGAWLMLSTPAGAETIAALDLDYICIDCQHGLLGYEEMRDILLVLRDAAPTPVVRVPWNDPAWIGKALDAGAHGIIVPLVNSADDAVLAARACRYPPEGGRSFGPVRSYQPFGFGPAEANSGVLCLPMIETQAGLDSVDAICATPGVDGVYIGPADLGLALGAGMFTPEHDAAVDRIRTACDNAGIVPGIHASDGAQARTRASQGFRMVTVVADATMLAKGGGAELNAARS